MVLNAGNARKFGQETKRTRLRIAANNMLFGLNFFQNEVASRVCFVKQLHRKQKSILSYLITSSSFRIIFLLLSITSFLLPFASLLRPYCITILSVQLLNSPQNRWRYEKKMYLCHNRIFSKHLLGHSIRATSSRIAF